MKTKLFEFITYIILVLALVFIGFYFGRSTVPVKTETKTVYIKGDTIRDVIYEPKPYKVNIPIDTISIIKQCIKDGIYQELWPEKTVTEVIEITKEDTTKIMVDWATKRIYDETIFDIDTIGSCKINAEVQYNRMHLLGYTYTPVTKQVTETKIKVKTFSPYVSLGYMINPSENNDALITASGGIFIKEKYGIELQLMHGLQTKIDYVGGSVSYKF